MLEVFNGHIYPSKCKFRTSFPSRRVSRLTFPSIWTGKLDEKVETRNSSVTGFTSDEFLVQDEFPENMIKLFHVIFFPQTNAIYHEDIFGITLRTKETTDRARQSKC